MRRHTPWLYRLLFIPLALPMMAASRILARMMWVQDRIERMKR